MLATKSKEKNVESAEVAEFFKRVKKVYPKFKIDEDTHWDKEIHNYKKVIYHETFDDYKNTWIYKDFGFADIIITVVKNVLKVDFSTEFLNVLKRKGERNITNLKKDKTAFLQAVKKLYPKFKVDKDTHWVKEIHNYKYAILKEPPLSYEEAGYYKNFVFASINITVVKNVLKVEFTPEFLKDLDNLCIELNKLKSSPSKPWLD